MTKNLNNKLNKNNKFLLIIIHHIEKALTNKRVTEQEPHNLLII